jgi:hypothetical protein
MYKPRNPVARSPLMRKGGPHQRAPSAIRAGQRKDIQIGIDSYRQMLAGRASGGAGRRDPEQDLD